jgi:hypothetical protein
MAYLARSADRHVLRLIYAVRYKRIMIDEKSGVSVILTEMIVVVGSFIGTYTYICRRLTCLFGLLFTWQQVGSDWLRDAGEPDSA